MTQEKKDILTARDVMDNDASIENLTLITDADTTVFDLLDYLSPDLYEQPELPGVAVQDGQQIVGMISRTRFLELASDSSVRRSIELAGVPQRRPHFFVCPKDPSHHKKLIVFFDPDDPPICPIHQVILVEEE